MGNIKKNSITSGVDPMTPLFSFHTIFDVDAGLAQLIYCEYLDPSIFNPLFFEKPFYEIISDLYYRKDPNPLTVFANDGIHKDILDEYYKQFKDECMDTILDNCVSTGILTMIQLFRESGEINPTILCYNELQQILVENEPILNDLPVILFPEITKKEKEKYTQYYFKYISELYPFTFLRGKNIYLSNCGLNTKDINDEIIPDKAVDTLAFARNDIGVINLYDAEIIKPPTINENKGEEQNEE